MQGKIFLAFAAACSLSAAVPGVAAAQSITIDGRLSPAQTLAGPNYAITANLGKQVGSNLFHSFGQFGLASSESANFSGPATVSNVIGRVTGGALSTINGKIASTIAGASLYLINPSGIVFGPHATVDVSGGFHASTADYLRMSDGARFQATNPDASTFSSAPPAAFGFLTAQPAKITVNGSSLGVPSGQTLGLAGGPVSISGAALSAPAGTIHVTSAAGAGEVPVDPRNTPALTVTSFGPVNIKGGSTLDVSDPSGLGSGGSVFIRSGALTIDASEINGDNYGSDPGGVISLRGDNQLTASNGAYVHAVAMGSGNGADVSLSTASSGAISADASTIQTGSTGPGNGGLLSVETGQLTLTNGAGFNSLAQGSGTGGDISITAGSVLLDIGPPVDPTTGLFSPVGIFSDTSGAGRGGSITITAGQLALHNGAALLAQSSGVGAGGGVTITVGGSLAVDSGASLGTLANAGGNAGDVWIHAGQVTVDMSTGFESSILLGIGSLTGLAFINGDTGNTGDAGNVTLIADALSVRNNSSVSSLTLGAGNSGRLDVNVSGPLSVSGPTSAGISSGVITSAGILGGSFGTGDAGQIAVTAGTLSIVNGGLIASDAFASGNAGSVSVTAGSMTIASSGVIEASIHGGTLGASGGSVSVNVTGELTIDGAVSSPFTTTGGIFSVAEPGSIQNGGNIFVKAGSITLVNTGEISSSALGPSVDSSGNPIPASIGNAGQVAVVAGALSIATNSEISSGAFASGKGGDVTVTVGGLLKIDGAGGNPIKLTGISTTSQGGGDAGTVTVTAGALSIAHNGLIASSSAHITSSDGVKSGNGGSVAVMVDGQLTIDGAGTIPNFLPTGIAANSYAGSNGNAGDVTVAAGALSIINGGAISSALQPFNALELSTDLPASTGNAGRVTVDVAGPLTLSGLGSRIGTETTLGSIGHAGTVAVTARQITLTDNATITSSTTGSGAGGSVVVDTANALSIDGMSIISAIAGPGSTGNAGDVIVNVGSLSISNGAQIASSTAGPGKGGDIAVTVANGVTLSGSGPNGASGISAAALPGSSGGAGEIILTAGGAIWLSNGAVVTSSSAGMGNGGSVQVMAGGPLNLIGSGTGIIASASATARGDAGSVMTKAPQITVSSGAEISSTTAGTGMGGSVIVMTPGALALDGAGVAGTQIAASATGPQSGPGGSVTVGADALTVAGGAQIASSTAGPGKGGDIAVTVANGVTLSGSGPNGASGISAAALPGSSGRAGEIVLTAGGAIGLSSGAAATSSTAGMGNGGSVQVTAGGPLTLTGSGTGIIASATASGDAGSVTANAPQITLSSGAEISSTTAGTGAGGPVVVTTPGMLTLDGAGVANTQIAASATGPQSGQGGSVTVAADMLTVEGRAQIASSTAGPGKGGDVMVTVGNGVALSGVGPTGASGITAAAQPGSSGRAGEVALSAGGAIGLSGGAEATSSTAGMGNGGSVRVTARGPLTLTGSGTGIIASATATASGDAGSVIANAPQITVISGAEISSTTAGSGAGGSVVVTTPGMLALDGAGVANTQIAASAIGPQSRSGGSVTVAANSLSIQGGARIASSTAGPGTGGDVNVTVATDIVLPDPGPQITARSTGSGDAGSITVSAVRLMMNDGASISTEAETSTANGGNITLHLRDFLYLVSSEISTSVKGETGNGGNIVIDPQLVILNHSSIIAQAIEGHGGNITITADQFIPSSDSIISATSELGISGTIVINGPRVDVNGALVVLSSQLRGRTEVLREACEARGGRPISSLVEAGRGGLPQDPEATLPALYIAGRDLNPNPQPAAGAFEPSGNPRHTTARLTMRCG